MQAYRRLTVLQLQLRGRITRYPDIELELLLRRCCWPEVGFGEADGFTHRKRRCSTSWGTPVVSSGGRGWAARRAFGQVRCRSARRRGWMGCGKRTKSRVTPYWNVRLPKRFEKPVLKWPASRVAPAVRWRQSRCSGCRKIPTIWQH